MASVSHWAVGHDPGGTVLSFCFFPEFHPSPQVLSVWSALCEHHLKKERRRLIRS